MKLRSIIVKAPATVANLVCGYDILGLCVHEPYDIMELKLIDEKKVIINSESEYNLPTDPSKNTAGAPLLAILDILAENIGFELSIRKNIKPGSGIGSSAASAAGAVVAANHLLENRFTKTQLVEFAMHGEQIASGVMHADNVAPCIFGGVTLVRSLNPLDIVMIDSPELFVTIVHPQVEIRTADARRILKKEVSLKDAIIQWGNVAGLVAGLMKKDHSLIGRSLQDIIIEPVRSVLIPGFEKIKKGSKKIGALGGGISGSGPSLFMLSSDKATADEISLFMSATFKELSLPHHCYVSSINMTGVTLMTD